MHITYRDGLGIVSEKVDEYGVSFGEEYVCFNDKKVLVNQIIEIREG